MQYTVTIKSGDDDTSRTFTSLADAISYVCGVFGPWISVTAIMRDCIAGIEHVSAVGDAYVFVLPTRH